MKTAIHIFRKDARRLKWEIGAVALLTLVVAWMSGRAGDESVARHFHQATGVLLTLAMVGWCYLTIRVVQADAMVGTDEDWMSRPVGWAELAGAKALGLGAFIVLPVAAGIGLGLTLLGVEPLTRAGAYAWYVVCFAGMLIVPAAAIGAVTRGLASAALAAIAVVFATGVSESLLPMRVKYWDVLVWAPLAAAALLAAGGGLAVLWVQYRHRRVGVGRGLIVGAVVTAAAVQSGLGWETAFGLQKAIGGSAAGGAMRVEASPLGGGGYTVRLAGFVEGRRVRILRVEGVAETAGGSRELVRGTRKFGQPEWEENVRVEGEAKRLAGVVWYQVLEEVGRSEEALRKDERVAGRCVLHVEKMKRDGLDPLLLCRWAFRAPEEVTVAVRMGDWESRQDLLRGTQAGSPFPAELGMPVVSGVTGVLPEGEFRVREAAEKGGRLVFRRWKEAGYGRMEFRVERGL